METNTQDRITLKNLKVADFASEETLCFTATVLFDGKPVATASNDGHGGSTRLLALEGQRDRLSEAEAFAASLPPDVSEHVDPNDNACRFTIDMTLDYLVDGLANTMHADRSCAARSIATSATRCYSSRTASCCSSRASSSRPSPIARRTSLRYAAGRPSPS
ncbi:hypothetical protein [Pseudomonas aeruginosa]